MKLSSILIGLFVFLLACGVSANGENLQISANDIEIADTGNSMTWPMLPGENLNALAAKFYPKNKSMQKKFVFKTLRLNTEMFPGLDPDMDFSVPTALVIPTLKSLSASTRVIRTSHQKLNKQHLHLSYNIKDAMENVPKSLLLDYENLVTRNNFLKEELAKLNEKLVFLQNKLNDLKLMLDKTLTLPQKKVFKNLDAQDKSVVHPTVIEKTPKAKESNAFLNSFDLSNKTLWSGILALIAILFLVSYLIKLYREKMYLKFINSVTQQEALTNFNLDQSLQNAKGQEAKSSSGGALNTDTQVDEYNALSILNEAKTMMAKGLTNEAVEHLKWSIRAKPKTAINVWLYLLELLRQQNLKDEFEKFALEMHQIFNVMTPLWEEREVAIVVADSLEKFPHIMKKITQEWPGEPAKSYLQALINDNRDGERGGFGQAVIDEIMLLISVLETRNDLWDIKGLIQEQREQVI